MTKSKLLMFFAGLLLLLPGCELDEQTTRI